MDGHENAIAGSGLTENPPPSKLRRRALVAGAAAAGAGFAAALIGRPSPADAANGGPVLLGESNTATESTDITSSGPGLGATTSATGQVALSGVDNSSGGGFGVSGGSTNGIGVYGNTGGDGKYGVEGEDDSSGGGYGVYGHSGAGTGVYGTTRGDGQNGVEGVGTGGANGVSGVSAAGVGVYGQTSGTGQNGVAGVDQSTGGGYGVSGISTKGVGVIAISSRGTALQVDGPAVFSVSGRATVAARAVSVVVKGVALTSSSVVLATPQGHVAGVGVAGVVTDVSAKKMTIYLTKAPATALKIAWFVINLPS
jgi:hypothetical protein